MTLMPLVIICVVWLTVNMYQIEALKRRVSKLESRNG